METKPEEVEVDESSVIEEEDLTKKFSEQEAEAIKLQLHTYSKNWLKDIQLWDEVEKKFHKVYEQKYCYAALRRFRRERMYRRLSFFIIRFNST